METPDGLKRCTCARGRALADAAKPVAPRAPILVAKEATMFVEMLASMDFFPPEAGARIRIGDEMRAICASIGEVDWLVTRMTRLFKKWPGLQEMRLVYCDSGRRPLDGLPALGTSELYPDGFPNEFPPAPEPKRITGKPDPGEISAAQSVEDTVRDLAELKDLNRVGPPRKVRDIPMRQFKPEDRITPEQLEEAARLYREEKAPRELELDKPATPCGECGGTREVIGPFGESMVPCPACVAGSEEKHAEGPGPAEGV